MQYHDGQILRISDLSVPARVLTLGYGRNAEGSGDYLRITEVREDGRWPSCYGYHRNDGSDQWYDCDGNPVTIEMVEDAPKPYRVGAEDFFDEMMVAILEGQAVLLPSIAAEFAEAVRNHVATEGCGPQWRALALGRLRGGHPNLYEPKAFISLITAFEEECRKPHQRRAEFYEKRRG